MTSMSSLQECWLQAASVDPQAPRKGNTEDVRIKSVDERESIDCLA